MTAADGSAWRAAHAAALRALQDAQREYHRLVASRAFAGAGPDEAQEAALARVDEARRRLDAVRSRQPREG